MINKSYDVDDLIPLSALQHLLFCERQCALIHIENLWRDNVLTLEGTHLHSRVDETGERRERRGDLVIVRGLPLKSLKLGVSGRADVVEFHRPGNVGEGAACDGVALRGISGRWIPFPVDYKRGKPKKDLSDKVQLCAQAICLEEMMDTAVPNGALFYGRSKRRCPVAFDPNLRKETRTAALQLHELVESGFTPKAIWEPKCERCSLIHECMPRAMKPGRSATEYLDRMNAHLFRDDIEGS